MLKNVIFDFGAVLFEWNPNQIVKTFTPSDEEQNLLLQQVLQHPDWISLDRGTMLIAEVIPKFSARTGLPENQIEDFIHHVIQSLTLINATLDIVELSLSSFKTFYLTNMSESFFESLNEQHPIISQFDGGIVSGKELMIKPEPEIFQLLLDRYALKAEESLFIDDNLANILAAKQLGFDTVLFDKSSQCYKQLLEKIRL
ncbi:TPA: HAD family hydrolase [Photobacterium damselae]